jgi:hypothetical protein
MGSDLPFVAVANKIHAEPDDEWRQGGLCCCSLQARKTGHDQIGNNRMGGLRTFAARAKSKGQLEES